MRRRSRARWSLARLRPTRADGHDAWLLRQLGEGFTALVGHGRAVERVLQDIAVEGFALNIVSIAATPADGAFVDRDGDVARRYDLQPGSVVLLRPDAHVCARWRSPTRAQVEAAMRRALAAPQEAPPCA
jgi:3-(3-hydroxy-phenyl)propionate hydroxylase